MKIQNVARHVVTDFLGVNVINISYSAALDKNPDQFLLVFD